MSWAIVTLVITEALTLLALYTFIEEHMVITISHWLLAIALLTTTTTFHCLVINYWQNQLLQEWNIEYVHYYYIAVIVIVTILLLFIINYHCLLYCHRMNGHWKAYHAWHSRPSRWLVALRHCRHHTIIINIITLFILRHMKNVYIAIEPHQPSASPLIPARHCRWLVA